jgi:hypothetical protein
LKRKLVAVTVAILSVAASNNPERVSAASSDTKIYVFYGVKAVRARPQPTQGKATGEFRILLRADGKVEDRFESKSGQLAGQKSQLKSRLGAQPLKAVYRVIDDSTIQRTTDLGTHFHRLTIKLVGKNCTATSEWVLKPGQKEYRDYSIQLKQMAYYSLLETEYATCVIE